MYFSKSLSLATLAACGIAGALAVPSGKVKPVNCDSSTLSGPVTGLSGVKGAVKQAVTANPGYSISFTGHSLGRATATIAAADGMVYLNGQVDLSNFYIMTNVCPRVGNSEIADLVSSAVGDIWRSANFDDIVPKVQSDLAETGLEDIKYFIDSQHNLEAAYVGVDNGRKTIVVAFRATIHTLSDWLGDFDIILTGAEFLPGEAQVGNGFLKAYKTVQSGVQVAVKKAVDANPGYTISFTGHSLGGATAHCHHRRRRRLEGKVDPSSFFFMTNGSPRVGNKDFADLVTSAVGDIWRSANFDDIVPNLKLEK
ncbi:Alpha/Beta hydrolase protein [Blyttiomyces helicus]|uniref:Alpha/Beta hydrolase protein n=1 Tax=Blyttiomyces helicus TaxID=388810 RepID=A0A4P9WB23_9FUNG|nr:Alpha/Beta hydrolase protein [Blyttiomyces helicus]|eukprot:RKO89674.1 Alpha/Beta hydrolase protein [Blyttiomyces helicus]